MHTLRAAVTLLATSICGAGLGACSDNNNTPDLAKPADMAKPVDLLPPTPKGVYTLSNDALDNTIITYNRAADGTLTAGPQPVSTAGKGTGAGLGDQGALVFDKQNNLFFAVNAGDNSVSMLSLQMNGTINLMSKRLSNGVKPISVTYYGNTVFVVNAGDNFTPPNISGFTVSNGMLMPIAGSSMDLTSTLLNPAQIQFSPDGTTLVVTERTGNKIDTWKVASGMPSAAKQLVSNGLTPFGFAFSANGKLIVSEASNGVANMGSASSYSLASDGTLTTVSNKIALNQTSPCWTVVSGSNAYITNAMSNNISWFKVATDGTLALQAGGNSGATGMGPTDEAVTETNDFLYVLNSKDHSISSFAIGTDGALTKKTDLPGVVATAVGLVAR